MEMQKENTHFVCRHCHTHIATLSDALEQAGVWVYFRRVTNMELIPEPVCILHGKLMGSLICKYCKVARGLGCLSSNPGGGKYFILLKDQLLQRHENLLYNGWACKFVAELSSKSSEASDTDIVSEVEAINEVQTANSVIERSTDEPKKVPSEFEAGTEKETNIQFPREKEEIPRLSIPLFCRNCYSPVATLDDQIGTGDNWALFSRVFNMDIIGEPVCMLHGRPMGSLVCSKCKVARGLGFLNSDPDRWNYFMLIEDQLLQRHGNILYNASWKIVAQLSWTRFEASGTDTDSEVEAKNEVRIENHEIGNANSGIKRTTDEPEKVPDESETDVEKVTSNSGTASRKHRKKRGKKRR